MNRDAVRDYIGEVCPVDISSDFPFVDKVKELFDGTYAPLTLEVMLDGDTTPIKRPFGDKIRLSTTKEADFTEFQEVRIPSVDDKCEAAVGWIAHSSYLGAIPREQRVRGIRVRVGNIQIGGEAVFDDLFVEERFNRWCVRDPNLTQESFQHRRDIFNKDLIFGISKTNFVLIPESALAEARSTFGNRARKALSPIEYRT